MEKGQLEIDQIRTWFEWCKREFHRTRGEEWANGLTHLAGFIFGIVALVLMTVFAVNHGNALCIISCVIYGISLLALTFCSTFYHLASDFRIKALFQVFDHCAIYFLIAGTYTPISLVVIGNNTMGWSIFGIEWGLTFVGLVIETLFPKIVKYVSLVIYLMMGWLILIDIPHVIDALPMPGALLLVAGGVSYTVGVIFYMMDRVPYMHTIWHIFVLGGIVCHWVAVAYYVIP